MVDISRFSPPEDKSSPDISRFAPPDISRFAPPEKKEAQKKESPGLGSELYAGAVGLASGVLGSLGNMESLITEQEPTPKLQAARQIFPPSSYIKEQFPKPAPGTEGSEILGENIPLIVGGAQLAKQIPKAITYGLGKLPDFLTKITGKEAASLGKEAEFLGQKVKGQTAASVAERAASEEQAAKEASAKAKELQSSKNPELQSQKDISEAKSAVSIKLIKDKSKATKATEESLNKLGGQAVSEEELGGLIQPLGRTNVKNLSKARQEAAITETKDPAFDRARSKEQGGRFIVNDEKSGPILNEAFSDLETQINRTTEPYRSQLQARLRSLKGREVPLSEGEIRTEQLRESSIPGYVAKTTKQEPMTLDQAEFMRRMLTDKDLAEQSGFAALDIARRTDIAKKLSAAMKEFEPGVGDYLSKYQQASVPITKALTGRGKQLTEAQELAEQEVLFSADKSATAKYYLDGTEEKAQRLVDLVGGKPKELVDSIGGFVRGKMQNMSAKQAEDFANQGIFKVFPELKQSVEQVVKNKQQLEKTSSLLAKQGAIGATGATGRLGKALGTEATLEQRLAQSANKALSTAEKAKDSANKFTSFNTHLETLAPEESLSQSKKFLSQMAQEDRIPQDAYKKSLQEIQEAEQAYAKFKDSSDLTKKLRRALTYKALATTVGGGTAYYFTH
jgi:hypothetical protein